MARASWSTYSVYKLFEVSAFVGVFALTIISSFSHASSLNIADLDCGGKLELETWRRWDQGGLVYVQHQLIDQKNSFIWVIPTPFMIYKTYFNIC